MRRKRPSGRTLLAKRILTKAATQAMLEQKRKFWFSCGSADEVHRIRNACYWYQQKWAAEVEESAILEGKDPVLAVNESLMKATWPSASLSYKFLSGQHWLVIEFKRIATDPSWDEMLETRLTSTSPEEPMIDQSEIITLLEEEHK